MQRLRKILLGLATVAAAIVLVASGALVATADARKRPEGVVGPEADALAREMIATVDGEAWERTGAVAWTMAGHEHLWDRERNLARVSFGGTTVWIDLHTKEGVAVRGGERLEGSARRKKLDQAYAWWINDSFWLNPVVKAFDEGTTRALVERGDARGVLVSYASGGLTPGDAYLWWLDEAGRPTRWQLWVSVIPVGGLSISWEEWKALRTGAVVSTAHRAGPVTFRLEGVRGAATLSELELGPDPFAVLFEGR